MIKSNTYSNVYQLRSTRLYLKVSGLAAWSQNCKWYRLPFKSMIKTKYLLLYTLLFYLILSHRLELL